MDSFFRGTVTNEVFSYHPCLRWGSRSTAITKRLVDMSDAEIGELLNVVRTTGFRHRKSALAKIKQYLEGKADDEHR